MDFQESEMLELKEIVVEDIKKEVSCHPRKIQWVHS